MSNIVRFPGVPLVRVMKVSNGWQVQEREDTDNEGWTDVGEVFPSKEEAIDEAPFLCGF